MWLRIDSIKQSPGLFDPKGGAKSLVQLRKQGTKSCLSPRERWRGEAVTERAPLRPDHGCKEADAGEGPFVLCSAPQKPIVPSI